MSILFFTNYNRYLDTHEAFKLDLLLDWHNKFGFNFFVRVVDDVKIDYAKYSNFYFGKGNSDDPNLQIQINDAIQKFKPKKVVNFLEKFFPFHMVNTDAEKIYFVRSCAAKLLERLTEYKDDNIFFRNAFAQYSLYAEKERKLLNLSQTYITTSPNSVKSVKEMYNIDCELCLEYVNPTKYNELAYGNDKNFVYNIGRRDFQKGLQFIKPPTNTRFLSIGKKEVGNDECVSSNIEMIDVLDFINYKNTIQNCVYGIYPSIWESNGYAVQECLAMGKIPIVQKGSGGNERLLNFENSFVINFDMGKTDWELLIENNSNYKIMQENARNTLTHEMYMKSFEVFVNKIIT